MLDIKFIRENPDLIRAAAKKKRLSFEVDELVVADQERLRLLREAETLRAEQNAANDQIAAAPAEARIALVAKMKAVKDRLVKVETELGTAVKTWQKLMLEVPNLPDVSVPEGESDADNQEVKTWGKKTKFDFTPRDHLTLMRNLDLADFERGTKVAGFRGYYLKNEAAGLSLGLWQWTFDYFVRQGFTPLIVPSLLRREALLGTGYLPQAEEEIYKTQDEMYLAGTAEVATMAYLMDEIIEADRLPLKFIAFSPCFRREAGSHGQDTKGLIRVHEFFKLEQVIIGEADHEQSVKYHEALTAHAEALLQALKLPYRLVANCGGDLGLGQVKKYDLEVWLPAENKYRETHSSSYFHDFQTRRLNIRYRGADGKPRFAHSLNNTAVATPRLLAAIVENYQTASGAVAVPEILQSYAGRKLIARDGQAEA